MNKINETILEQLQDVKNKENKQQITNDALQSLELTNNIVESIMAGKQIDLAFYSLYSRAAIKKIKGSK